MRRVWTAMPGVLLAALIVFFGASLPARAVETTDPRVIAALDLLSAMEARSMFVRQFESSLPSQMAEIKKAYPNLTDDSRKRIERIFREETADSIDGLMKDIALIYAKRFSVEEMQRIAEFHRSAAGKKLRVESDPLQKELNGVANTWSMDVIGRISKRLRQEVKPAGPTS